MAAASQRARVHCRDKIFGNERDRMEAPFLSVDSQPLSIYGLPLGHLRSVLLCVDTLVCCHITYRAS